MYILAKYTSNQYKLFQSVSGVSGQPEICTSILIGGKLDYSLSLLHDMISTYNPENPVFSPSGIQYYIDYLLIGKKVGSWTELREEVKNLAILDAL